MNSKQLVTGNRQPAMSTHLFICLLSVTCCLLSCKDDAFNQRPRGYFKIDLPEKRYQSFNQEGFPYSFEYPVYGQIVRDRTFFEDTTENPYWVNVDFPQYNCQLHLTYKGVKNNFDSLINDAFKLAQKQHTQIALGIQDSLFQQPAKGGIYFTLKGNTATANQFFVTDSTNNFLRGALYFDATPNEDSLRPVNQFFKQDIIHLINTLKWK